MKQLNTILPDNILETSGDLDIEISGIKFDSREVELGDLFVALSGHHIDGSVFIFDAIEKGAVAIVTESDRNITELPVIKVHNTRQALSEISNKFYDDPSKKINLLGITGTKGKTTTSFFVQNILKKAFNKAFRIGTIEHDMCTHIIPAKNTTPESQIIHSLLSQAIKDGINNGIMEVSSHALKTSRVEHLSFSVAAFTNLSLEHTDFHATMEDYYLAKKRLFTEIAPLTKKCLVSIDDEYGERLAKECKESNLNIFTVSLHNSDADFYCKDIQMNSEGSEFIICNKKLEFNCKINLAGDFNIANALMAAAMCHVSGIDVELIQKGLAEIKNVPGRLEAVENNLGVNIIVDYAHSPAALENVLKTLRPLTKGRLITVFGCGGNRSVEKRPIMGKIAWDNSDIIIITSDNPRQESPETIIFQIAAGITAKSASKILKKELDRKKAIEKAIGLAQTGDTIIIAGKGHETGQIFADKVLPFDDRAVIKNYLHQNHHD